MTEQHPITPPPKLVQQWLQEVYPPPRVLGPATLKLLLHIATQAARWGSDQELEACCAWLRNAPFGMALNKSADQFRAARRPKSPSLKEQALAALHGIDDQGPSPEQVKTIRRAIEQLPDTH